MHPVTAPRRYTASTVVAVGFAVAVWLVLYFLPPELLGRVYRIVGMFFAVMFAGLAVAAWWLLYSGGSLTRRVSGLATAVAVIVGLRFALVREVHFDGDMLPLPTYRWQTRSTDRLAVRPPIPYEVTAVDLAATADDFPEYRNRLRDGVVPDLRLERDWVQHPPRQRWRHQVGGGYAGCAVVGNLLVTIEQRGGNEVTVGYNAVTGAERWTYPHAALFAEPLGGDGPRATPTISGDEVFTLGATGHLACLNATNGVKKWSAEILNDNSNVTWAMSGSPLVAHDLVIVNPGTNKANLINRALVAYDRSTGSERWARGTAQAGYSSPQLATLAGQEQVLIFDAGGLAGHDIETGAELWRHPWETHQGINVAQPLLFESDRVFISSGYQIGSAMLHITESSGQWNVEQLWKSRFMRSKFASPVRVGQAIYGLDDGILACIDAGTGKQLWKGNRYGHGQLLLVDDQLLILSETGKLVLVEASPAAFRELASIPVLQGLKTWNPPTVARGRAYLRNHEEMTCFELPRRME